MHMRKRVTETASRRPLPASDNPSRREEIYSRLREDIVTLRRPPGTPMSDKAISAELNISRTPVREAILRLVDEDLVTVIPSSGTFVTKIHAEALRNAKFVRSALERTAAAAAAKAASRQDVSDLKKIVASQVNAAENSQVDFYELDEAFHRRIFAISGHDEAWNTILRSKAQLDRVRYLSLGNESRLSQVVCEHSAIIEAIAAGEVTAAEASMLRHLDAAYVNVNRAVEVYQQYFARPEKPKSLRKY